MGISLSGGAKPVLREVGEAIADRFAQWNSIVDDLKPISEALVLEKSQKVIDENALPKVFIDTVNWDILGVLMEAEYADIVPPGFYASQSFYYWKGHFPCGWDGEISEFPKGRLIVY